MTRQIDRVHERRIRELGPMTAQANLVRQRLVDELQEATDDELRDVLGLPPQVALTYSREPVVVTVVVKGPQPSPEDP